MTRFVSWPRVGVQTVKQLQRKHRRLDRRTLSAEVVVSECTKARACTCIAIGDAGRCGGCRSPLPKYPTPSPD